MLQTTDGPFTRDSSSGVATQRIAGDPLIPLLSERPPSCQRLAPITSDPSCTDLSNVPAQQAVRSPALHSLRTGCLGANPKHFGVNALYALIRADGVSWWRRSLSGSCVGCLFNSKLSDKLIDFTRLCVRSHRSAGGCPHGYLAAFERRPVLTVRPDDTVARQDLTCVRSHKSGSSRLRLGHLNAI